MLDAKQVLAIMWAEFDANDQRASLERAAEKIVAAMPDYDAIMVSSAALENEVTSTLMDMLAATILGSLIDQEGGGRTNITFSPHSMQETLKHWSYKVETDGLIRTVRISPARPEDWETGNGDDLQKGMIVKGLGPVVDTAKVLPQAEPHVYDRPVWAIRVENESEPGTRLLRMHDQADATRQLRGMIDQHPTATIENRFCLHPECPASGCNEEKSTEVASEG